MKAKVNKTTTIAPDKATKAVKSDKMKRYSEKELAEFHKIIVAKLDEAKKDNEILKSTFSYDDNGTNDTSRTFDIMEDGSAIEAKEEAAQFALRQEMFIRNLQNALTRIKNKTYGICRVTGNLIPKERLLSVPHATLCIDAKLERQFPYNRI